MRLINGPSSCRALIRCLRPNSQLRHKVYDFAILNVLILRSVMFEGVPTHPDAARSWQIVEKYKVTQFYTGRAIKRVLTVCTDPSAAPTAIRTLQRFGDLYPNSHDLSSLRILGTVGEPINPQAWLWLVLSTAHAFPVSALTHLGTTT